MFKTAEKTCGDLECEETNPQPLSEFYRMASTEDGHYRYCKSCTNRYRRMDYVPFFERNQSPFQGTKQFKTLGMAKTCIGMAQLPLSEVCADLCLQAKDYNSKETYQIAVSALKLAQQVQHHIDWLMKAGEERTDHEYRI
jgi:hypothetical protein